MKLHFGITRVGPSQGESLMLLTGPLSLPGVRPEAAEQLDGETRTDSDLFSSLQLTDQGICGSLRQQGRLSGVLALVHNAYLFTTSFKGLTSIL